MTLFHDWKWAEAELQIRRATELNPRNAEALSYYAIYLGFVERYDEALTMAKRAIEVDPLSVLINMNVGWAYYSAGLVDEAFSLADKIIEIEPAFFGSYWLKGATCLGGGDYEQAIEYLTKRVSLGEEPLVLADLGAANALAGHRENAEKILAQLLEKRRTGYVPAICIARIYSRLGDNDNAIEWFEKAYGDRNGEMIFLESEIAGAAPSDSLNTLINDPRVIELLARMNLPTNNGNTANNL